VFEVELTGVLLTIHMLHRLPQVKSALILLNNQATITTLTNNSRQSGQHILDAIHMHLKSLHWTHRWLKIHVEWVPGHTNVAGNESADELAKKAAEGISSPCQHLPPFLQNALPTSIIALKAACKTELHLLWVKLWKASLRFLKISCIDPCIPSNKACQILTGCPSVMI